MKNVKDIYPLTPMQQGLLFYTLYAPDSGLYVEQLSCTLSGNLNIAAFEQAWLKVIERHTILRTAFVWDGLDEPLQVVRENVNLPLVELDWERLAPDVEQRELEQLLQTDRGRGFDLSESPLMRMHLIRLGESRYQFVWSYHHLLLDGWSTFLVLGEFLSIYEAACHQQHLQLEPSRPFRDYIAWLQQQDYQKAEAFWQRTLEGFTAPTQVGILRAPVNGFRYADDYRSEPFVLSKELTVALHELARRQHLTLNTLVQGAWALLLSRYSGEEEVTFGMTVAGRPASLAGVEKMVGLFINTLPLRVRVPEKTALLKWLRQLQEQQIELREFDYSSLPEVQRQSGVGPGQSLFESLLVFENYPVDKALRENAGSLEIGNVEVFGKTNYPLNLMVRPGPQLSLQIVYDSGRCDGAPIRRMGGHLQNLLQGFVVESEQCLAAIPLLTEAEEQQVLLDWNDTAITYPSQPCLQQLFEEQADRTPDAVALIFEDQQLSYNELNRRANQLAHYLRRLGVGSERPIGVMMDRSVEMVVALLGILKAGGAYVPLDAQYPRERLMYILADAQARMLLTERRWAELLIGVTTPQVRVDEHQEEIARQSTENPSRNVGAQNLAYIIYTSGSTGQPKGVAIEHHSAVTLLHWAHDVFSARQLAGVLASTSICFDLSVFELFAPLSWGGKVILADNALHLPTLPAAEEVTLINTVPSAMTELNRIGGLPSSVIAVNLAGEALKNDLVQQIYEAESIEEVFNLYGPSEDTTYSTYARMRKGANESPTIGRPVANTQVYILDGALQLVPVGVSGELYIGGDGLARGYLNRPELTAERFIPHPFSLVPGARLYQTGDRVRYLPNGELDYLGRLDYQVKIRGFRIELGEIEGALQQHPALRDAVVVVREGAAHRKQIAAYVVANEQAIVSAAGLRQYLKTKLPEYMIPQAFVTLEQLPLTPNGKVNRRALPAPAASRAETAKAIVEARTPVEEVLVGIWSEVLGVEAIGVEDDFFELGGHSLLVTQVMSRARAAFGVEVALRELFERPTVRELAPAVEQALARGEAVTAPPIVRVDRDRELPLSFAQQRLWFIDQLEPGSVFYNSPSAVRLTGELNLDALQRTFTEIVRRHEVLRTTFKATDSQPVQVISPAQTLELPVTDLSHLADEQREAEAMQQAHEEALRPFDLSRGLLLRVKLLRLREQENIVLLTMHHIVTDEWSMGVLVKEVATLYTAFAKGEPSPLADLPIQYADFAAWQREWLQGGVLDEKLSYWRQQLSGVLPLLRLPTDHPRPAVQTVRGSTHTFELPNSLHDALKKLSRQEGCTLFMTLLAAFKVLLHRYTQQTDILVGTAIANRTRSETEALIGFFVNTLVLRTNLSGNPGFRELLHRVREGTLSAYSHQDVPFEKIVEAVAPERDTNYTPLIQVAFGMRNAPMRDLKLPALTLQTIDLDDRGGRFDLTLWMSEREGRLKGKWYYHTDLFEATTIRRTQGHFQTLLQSIVDHPEARLRALEIHTAEEKEQHLNKRKAREESNIEKLRTTKRRVAGQSSLREAESSERAEKIGFTG